MNLSPLTTSNTTPQPSTSAREAWEKRQEKQWQNMQEGLQRLRAMPSPKETAKARAESRLEQLKERIKQLRAMLIGLPPEQAKAILRQIGAIAKELASLAKAAGGDSGGTGTSVQVQQSGSTTAETAGDSATTSAAAVSTTPTDAAANAGNGDAEQSQDGDSQDKTQPAQANTPARNSAGNAKSLRDKLQEVAKQLKALLELVKAKMRDARQQEENDVKEAENALRQVDTALNGSSSLYSGLGAAAGITPTLTTASVAIAGNISVQA